VSNIVSFKQANLPAVSSLSTALRSISNNVGEAGTAILKMDKTGHWVFGADQTEVEDGSKWAVNPFSFVHGFIAWGDGEVLGEKMVSVTQPLPEMDVAPPGAKRGWETQIGCSLKCVSGDDEGLEVRFSTTSVGGKRAVQNLAVEIAAAVEKDQSKPVPIVTLKKDHYVHKSYGRIYTPVFEILEWISMDGSSSEGEEAEQAESQTEEPRRRRRSV
jgi:hypothetical protein